VLFLRYSFASDFLGSTLGVRTILYYIPESRAWWAASLNFTGWSDGVTKRCGIGVSHVLDRYRWIRIPNAYFLSYIPFKIVNIDLLTIVVFSVSMLAAVVAWAAVSVTRRIGPHVEIN